MYLAKIKPGDARSIRSVLLSIAVVSLVCTASANAQSDTRVNNDASGTGTGGQHTIEGHVRKPSGHLLNTQARVKLRSAYASEQFTTTDGNGAFTFSRLRSGTDYVVVEAGVEYESASDTVDIVSASGNTGSAVNIQITLQPKQTAKQTTGIVDASMAEAPEAPLKLYKEAIVFVQAGKREKAIEQLKSALSIYPDFMLAFNEMGVQYIKLRKWDKAAESLRSALRLAPDEFAPNLNYAIVLLQMKDFTGAAAALEQALKKDCSSAAAHFYYGQALVWLGKYDGAERELRQTIELKGDEMVEAYRLLGAVYIEMRNNQRAAEELEKYLSHSPKAKDADRIRDIIKQLRVQK
ncbi:MAG: tetratricopeptide repeat protein [Blastocatellia bacterium]